MATPTCPNRLQLQGADPHLQAVGVMIRNCMSTLRNASDFRPSNAQPLLRRGRWLQKESLEQNQYPISGYSSTLASPSGMSVPEPVQVAQATSRGKALKASAIGPALPKHCSNVDGWKPAQGCAEPGSASQNQHCQDVLGNLPSRELTVKEATSSLTARPAFRDCRAFLAQTLIPYS